MISSSSKQANKGKDSLVRVRDSCVDAFETEVLKICWMTYVCKNSQSKVSDLLLHKPSVKCSYSGCIPHQAPPKLLVLSSTVPALPPSSTFSHPSTHHQALILQTAMFVDRLLLVSQQ